MKEKTKILLMICGFCALLVIGIGATIKVADIFCPPIYCEKHRGVFWDGYDFEGKTVSSISDEIKMYNSIILKEYNITMEEKRIPLYRRYPIIEKLFQKEIKKREEFLMFAPEKIYIDPFLRYLWYVKGAKIYVHSVRPHTRTIDFYIMATDVDIYQDENSTNWRTTEP